MPALLTASVRMLPRSMVPYTGSFPADFRYRTRARAAKGKTSPSHMAYRSESPSKDTSKPLLYRASLVNARLSG